MTLAGIVTHQCLLTEKHSQRILYKVYNQCKQTLRGNDDCNTFMVSIQQQRMRKSYWSCLLLRVSVCVSTLRETTNTVARYSGWAGEEDTHTHTYTHTVVNTFLLACMKRLFRPAVPLQAQLWSLTLFRENISFTLWCLLIYKKANPTLKIAWLVWNSGRMKQTLSGTQMLVKTTFIFHSGHVTTLLFFETDANAVGTYCGWTAMPAFEELNISGKKLLCCRFPSAQIRHIILIETVLFQTYKRTFIFSQLCPDSNVKLKHIIIRCSL